MTGEMAAVRSCTGTGGGRDSSVVAQKSRVERRFGVRASVHVSPHAWWCCSAPHVKPHSVFPVVALETRAARTGCAPGTPLPPLRRALRFFPTLCHGSGLGPVILTPRW